MGSPVPPKRYFEALGLSQNASEAAVIIAYHRLSEGRQKDVKRAYETLRNYHRTFARSSTGGESSEQVAESTKGRNGLVPSPPLRYFTALGLGPGASAQQTADALETLSQAIQGDKDEKRLSASINTASSILQSYFRRQGEAIAKAHAQKRVQARGEVEAESAAEAEALAASFTGPIVVRQAYEKLSLTPGTSVDEADLRLRVLLGKGDVAPKLAQEYKAAALKITRYWDKVIGECVTVRQSSHRKRAEKTAANVTHHPLVTGYLRSLHLAPGASLKEVKQSYSSLRVDSNLKAPEKRRIDRAYKFMVQYLVEASKREARQSMMVKAFRRIMMGSAAIVFLALLFVSINTVGLRAMINSIKPGDELYDRRTTAYFGTVLAYEKEHQFRAGAPSPAFLVLMAGTDSEVWVSADYARKLLSVSDEDE